MNSAAKNNILFWIISIVIMIIMIHYLNRVWDVMYHYTMEVFKSVVVWMQALGIVLRTGAI